MDKKLRQNVRNAWFSADTDALLDQWNQWMAAGQYESAKYIRELLDEALDEIQQTSCRRYNWTRKQKDKLDRREVLKQANHVLAMDKDQLATPAKAKAMVCCMVESILNHSDDYRGFQDRFADAEVGTVEYYSRRYT